MMTKKKRKTLIISSLIMVVLIIVTSLTILYLNTDMFKSNQTLFLKYFGKNIENIKQIENILKKTQYENILKNSKYIEEAEIKVNYTEDYGTTLENTSNSINSLKLKIEGQVDNINQYNYKDIKLLKDNEKILEVEYAQTDNTHAIRFSDLFKQYILVENNNLKEILKKMGYSEEEIENLPEIIEIKKEDIVDSIKFSDEEILELEEKYVNILNNNFTKENFSKQTNKIISINQKEFKVNAYILRLTNEQLNNIYIDVLEKLKEEEIILTKLNKIQYILNKSNINFSETIGLREKFIQEINEMIEEINSENIGTEETKIIVYENGEKTVRTTIQGIGYEINFDNVKIGQENYTELNFKVNENKAQKIAISRNDEKISLNIEGKENNIPNILSIEEEKHIEDKKCRKNINIKYEDATNKLESNIIINTNVVDNFEDYVVFNNENSIELKKLNEEELNAILNRISEEIGKKLESVAQEIKLEDLQQILINIGILNDIQILEGEGISELEKNRFNSRFEILEGENIDSIDMLKIIEVIKDNIVNIQAVSNMELKIEIGKDNNEDIVKALEDFVKKEKSQKYNAKVEYDETGLVKYVVLTIVEKTKR